MENTLKQTREIKPITGSETEKNLHTALSAEAQAYLRYRWFELNAKSDGYIDIAKLFETTAGNEAEHAEIWFRALGSYSATPENLQDAAEGEHFEWATLYADFARTAREEGFSAIATLFERVGEIEKEHETNFRKALEEIDSGRVFRAESPTTRWICLNCGYVTEAAEPPAFCPVCAHPQGYFARKKT